MDFAILGVVEARRDGVPIPLGGPKQRALLALLLLAANRPVSRDRLIEGLWAESPPASAAASLDSYVSRLRRLLGPDRLQRRPPGYALHVEPGELDLDRFEALVAEAHAEPTPERRARLFSDALQLWRGPAFEDLLYEPFANVESERLEDRRLAAREQRIDAELDWGLAGELVAELEQLVREHPLRETPVNQLALALYRDGRQADALAALRAARRRLAEEVGLEPGLQLRELERRILRHDPTLRGASRSTVAETRGRVTRRRAWLAAVAATALVSAVAVVALRTGSSSSTRVSTTSRLVAIAVRSRRVGRSSVLANPPAALAAGFGSLWAADPNGQEVLRIDLSTGEVTDRIAVGAQPSSLAVGRGAVWVASAVGGLISRIDPSTDRRTETIRLGGANPAAIVFDAGSLWVADATDRSLIRIDPDTGSQLESIALDVAPTALVAGGGEIWVAGYDTATVEEVDLASRQVVDDLPVGQGPAAVALGRGSVWVASSLDGTLTRIDALTGVTRTTVPTGSGPAALTVANGSVWVANEYSGTVTQVDMRTGTVQATLHSGGEPTTLAFAASRLWVGSAPAADLHRGGTLRLSGTTYLTTVDPAFEFIAEPTQLPRLAYDTLVSFDNAPGAAGLRLVPDLALALPQPTDGGLTYAFRLRPGIRYSNGRLVEASDFRRAFERIFRAKAPGTTFYASIDGAAACIRHPAACELSRGIVTDDARRTVIFHLARPDPDFLFELTEFAYTAPVPPGTPDRNLHWQPLPGTGPYRIVEAAHDHVRLERNPYFHEWSHAAQPDGNPDTIVWQFPPTHEAEIRDIEQGKADWTLDFIPVSQLRTIERTKPALLHVNPAFIVEFIPTNSNIPPFNSVKVRRALNDAIDRREIARLYGGSLVATPLCQPLPPGMPGYVRYCPYTKDPNAAGTYTGPDLAKARRLVGASGRRGSHIEVWATPDVAGVPPTVPRYITHVLRALGFRVTLHVVHLDTITEAERRKFQISVDGDWLLDFPSPSSFLPSFFGCNGAHSNGYECNPQLDRQMRRAAAENVQNPSLSAQLWAAADKEITDDAYWATTVNIREVDLVSHRLHNYEFNPVWGFLADQAWVR